MPQLTFKIPVMLPKALFIIFSLILCLSSAQRTAPPQTTVGREEGAPIISPLLQEYTSDLLLTPGVTQRIEIHLKGENETINFEFQAQNATESAFLYQVSTIMNGQYEAQRFFNFTQPEAFQVDLDYENKQASIVSDNDFFISSPIQEVDYQIIVTQERVQGPENTLQKENSEKTKIALITGAVGGSCALVILSVAIVCFCKKRKSLSEVLPAKDQEPKRLQTETMSTARDLLQKVKEARVDTENLETECNDTTFTSSNRNVSQHTSKVPSITDGRLLTEENTALEKVNESNNDDESGISDSSQVTPKVDFALDMMDFEPSCTRERRMPTAREIRALAQKMEEEGLIGCGISEGSSDDEDQYEAPQLPNYFCCLICFEGTRCTIAEPCRHIFACKNCVEELLNTYKVCVLCSRDITNYELL